MSKEPKRDWTQHDIVEETRQQHSGPGFFNVLGDVCEEAFGGALDYEPGSWQFPMRDLTIGQLLDFFGARNAKPCLDWHNESGGPRAYVEISDYDLAEAFQVRFKIDWLNQKEERERSDEDMLRASGWRP